MGILEKKANDGSNKSGREQPLPGSTVVQDYSLLTNPYYSPTQNALLFAIGIVDGFRKAVKSEAIDTEKEPVDSHRRLQTAAFHGIQETRMLDQQLMQAFAAAEQAEQDGKFLGHTIGKGVKWGYSGVKRVLRL